MSKISFPRRKPISSFGAPAFRKARPLADMAVAVFLIAILGFPALFGKPYNIQASSGSVPAPYSAPPEVFVTVNQSRFAGLFSTIIGKASDAVASLKPNAVPAGLENAKLPTMTERMMSKVVLAGPAKLPPTPPQPTSVVDFDFDGDGKADIGRWHGSNTEFKVRNSNGGSFSTFTVGSSSAVVAPGDFNGDGNTDAGVFNAGTWTYKTSTGATAQTISWGTTGDIPVAGDYDGDGTTDAAIFRPSTNTWWVSKSSGGYTSTSLGSSGDIPVTGDYDGDGKNDLAVYRPSNGNWYINPSNGSSYTFNWGSRSTPRCPLTMTAMEKLMLPYFDPRLEPGMRAGATTERPSNRLGETIAISLCPAITTATTRQTLRYGGRRPEVGICCVRRIRVTRSTRSECRATPLFRRHI